MDEPMTTKATDEFVERIPTGAYYVLSREGQGIDFSGNAGDEARALADENFRRIEALTGLSLKPKQP